MDLVKSKHESISEDMCEPSIANYTRSEISELKQDNSRMSEELTKHITTKDRLLADIEILKTQLDSGEWQKRLLEKSVKEKDIELEIQKNKLECSEEIVSNLKNTVQNFKDESNRDVENIDFSFDQNESKKRLSCETEKNERISAEVLEYYSMWVNDKRSFEEKIRVIEEINEHLQTKLHESLLTVVRLTEEVQNFDEYKTTLDLDHPEEDKIFENVDQIVNNKDIINNQKDKYNLTKNQYRKSRDFNDELCEHVDSLETQNRDQQIENTNIKKSYDELYKNFIELETQNEKDVSYSRDNISEFDIKNSHSEHNTQNVFDLSFDSVNLHQSEQNNMFYEISKKTVEVHKINNDESINNESYDNKIFYESSNKTIELSKLNNEESILDQSFRDEIVERKTFGQPINTDLNIMLENIDNNTNENKAGNNIDSNLIQYQEKKFDASLRCQYSPRCNEQQNFMKYDVTKSRLKLGDKLDNQLGLRSNSIEKQETMSPFGRIMSQLGCGGGT